MPYQTIITKQHNAGENYTFDYFQKMSANETLWRGDVVIDQSEEHNERYLSSYNVTMKYMQPNLS